MNVLLFTLLYYLDTYFIKGIEWMYFPENHNINNNKLISDYFIYFLFYLREWEESKWAKKRLLVRHLKKEKLFKDYHFLCLSPKDEAMMSENEYTHTTTHTTTGYFSLWRNFNIKCILLVIKFTILIWELKNVPGI